jgi:hypothetical protein
LADALRATVKGVISLAQLHHVWPKLRRYLCDSPRKRRRRILADLTVLSEAIYA